jgi:3'-5' exoribonuclease
MKTPYVSELEANQLVQGVFLVQNKEVRQKKSGEPYLSLTLCDRTGELDAKMWDNAQEAAGLFDRDDFIRVKGLVQVFQNRPQLTIHKLQPVSESAVDISDFLPASSRDRDEMFAELRQWISSMTNPYLKAMLEKIFEDEKIALAYRTAPAAKSIHHAWIGGLVEHVLSLCHVAKFTAAHYPGIDFDLLLTGVILHDIGKIFELTYTRSFGYTSEGQLIGHINIGTRMVDDAVRAVPGFPPLLRDLVIHMILSHHGALEFGSAKLPSFPEALLLHLIDNMDSKMEAMRAAIAKHRRDSGLWTGWVPSLERTVLKKNEYLSPSEHLSPSEDGAAAALVSPSGSTPLSVRSVEPSTSPVAGAPAAGVPAASEVGPASGGRAATNNGRRQPDSPFAAKLQDALRRDTES